MDDRPRELVYVICRRRADVAIEDRIHHGHCDPTVLFHNQQGMFLRSPRRVTTLLPGADNRTGIALHESCKVEVCQKLTLYTDQSTKVNGILMTGRQVTGLVVGYVFS